MNKYYSLGTLLAVSALMLLLMSSDSSRTVKVGEEFTLHPGEKVVIADTDLTIKLKVVGNRWYSDRRAHSPYAELIVSGGGAAERPLTLSKTATVGDYVLKLVAANPFRHNGGPDCKLVVTRR
jgi:hypothetical protein